jgi:hypothetical protein
MKTTRLRSRLLNLGALFVLPFLSLFPPGCGGGPGGLACTDLYAYGLNVTVRDDATSSTVCDAVVTAVDGAYSEVLQSQPTGSSCAYVGAGERAGNYTITATKSGFMDATQSGVVVTADACHVKGVTVMLRLKR